MNAVRDRLWRRLRGLALCLPALGIAAAARPAAASEQNAYGYVFNDQLTLSTGVPYMPPNQKSNAGGGATVERKGVGRYEVTFPNVFSPQTGLLGVAHVTSATINRPCQVQGSYAFGQNVQIGVGCHEIGTTTPRDAQFWVTFNTSDAPPLGFPGEYASLIADEPDLPSYTPQTSFSSRGPSPEVRKGFSPGQWVVRLPGFTDGGNVQVTPYFLERQCAATMFSPSPGSVNILVVCSRPDGTPADDAIFGLSYSQRRNVIGVPFASFAYLRTDKPSTSPFWFNSDGPTPSITGANGFYTVTIPNVGEGPFTVQVTPSQPETNTCFTRGWTITGGTATGEVACRTYFGRQADTFFALALTSQK